MELHPYLHKVQFYETDGMSIVHHGNYILWMEGARTDFMDQIGWSYHRAVDAGIDFAVTDVSCKYRSMTRFGETVAIHMAVESLSPAKMQLSYKMVSVDTGELRAEGTSGHFFYDRAKARPVALKRALPDLWQLLQSLHEEGRNGEV